MKKYSFLISWKEFEVENQQDLEVLFKVFSWNTKVTSLIHWNILMEIDEDIEDIIVDYNWLTKCLSCLNDKNSFLLLTKIWDKLSKIITNTLELAEILSKIPSEENKIRLLKILRTNYLLKIIHDARDLWNILEWLYWDSQKQFIDIIWQENIKKIFLSTNEIIIILYYLTNENKDYLMNILWLDWVKYKIKTSRNFLDMYRWLTDKKAVEFLKKFEISDIKHLFKNQQEFYKFMLRLPKSKEKLLLKYLNLWN